MFKLDKLTFTMYIKKYSIIYNKIWLAIILMPFANVNAKAAPINNIMLYPAPKGEVLNRDYHVSVQGKSVAVYNAKVGASDNTRRFKAVDDLMHSADYFDIAGFCYFAMHGVARINVSVKPNIVSVKVLPASANIKFNLSLHTVSFYVQPGQNLTVEINGEVFRSLHIFANPIEANVTDAKDPNVIYFGPGIHEVTSMIIGSNKTVYIAGGAIVRAVIGKDEKFGLEPSGLRNYPPTFIIAGQHIKFIGQGIIDASACTTHSRNLLFIIKSADVTLSGVILRDASGWTAPVRQSNQVLIENIKILGYRANTDGIDICNSNNVTVDDCFVRTNDDLVVIKTWENQGPSSHITVRNCVLWNQLASALSLGAELRENVDDVLFTNCDVIHDTGREWSLRIFQCDSSMISNIRFENINIEESHQFVSIWIGKTGPSLNQNLGRIDQVSFKNIKVNGSPLGMEIIGGDNNHEVENVTFNTLRLNGKALMSQRIRINPYVKNIIVTN